jgi:hypothetical protein
VGAGEELEGVHRAFGGGRNLAGQVLEGGGVLGAGHRLDFVQGE